MNIYETGIGAVAKITGERIENHEYVAILEAAQEKNIEEAFEEFVYLIKKDFSVESVSYSDLSVTTTQHDVYQMAHEVIKNGRKYKYKPSNLLRYLNTRDFRYENLFIDKRGELIDITTHAIKDIRNHSIHLQMNPDYYINLRLTPDFVLKTLDRVINWRWMFNRDAANTIFNNISPYAPKINMADNKFLQLLSNGKRLLEFVAPIPCFYDYIFYCHDLDIKVTTSSKKEKISNKGLRPQQIIDYFGAIPDGDFNPFERRRNVDVNPVAERDAVNPAERDNPIERNVINPIIGREQIIVDQPEPENNQLRNVQFVRFDLNGAIRNNW